MADESDTVQDRESTVLVGQTVEGDYRVIGHWTPDWRERGLEAARRRWTGPGLYQDVHLAVERTTHERIR